MRPVLISIAALVVVLLSGQQAAAQVLTLSVNPPSFSYTLVVDPDSGTPVTGGPITVAYTITKSKGNINWSLTMKAEGDLSSGTATIPTTNISFATTLSAGAGTLTNNDQTLASGKGNVSNSGTVTFTLLNLWTYAAGTYTQTVTFTLSVF